ncbi:hypothetical protein [Poseidonocella sedimentorum]|uniref:Uncharacterized protein n=1 Tax=Poseidonocella sedimentorum TaxID=871652 RepID=A0A1I6D601_9RHOB|nr:hypothetical protein [Poseidonocella sedimentorum]SFR00860.1 hypothetical protein SAMN04515673_102237 [Poseidonocella sedimentorum]
MVSLISTALRDGVWELELSHDGPALPDLAVMLDGTEVARAVASQAGDGRWQVRAPLPPEVLHDGLNTFLLCASDAPDPIASLPVMAGAPLDPDIRAELDQLRSELDLLKSAFRRHCRDGS